MTIRILRSIALTALCLAIALVALPSVGNAATKGGWVVGGLVGMGLPQGDFSDEDGLDAESGMQFGVELGYLVSDGFLLGIDASRNKNKHAAEGTVEDLGGGETLTADKDRFISVQYGVFGRYLFATAGKFDPFVNVGLGFHDLEEDYEYTYDDGVNPPVVFTDEDDVANGDFEQPGSRFGWRVGVGFDYMTSPKLGLGVSADYTSISMDEDEFGVSSLSSINLRGRITYHLVK